MSQGLTAKMRSGLVLQGAMQNLPEYYQVQTKNQWKTEPQQREMSCSRSFKGIAAGL